MRTGGMRGVVLAGVLGVVAVCGAQAPVRISGGVMAGQILTKVQPVYPEEARAQHIAGAVVLHAVIGVDGKVEQLTVISGPTALRHAVLDAVSQWTYKPYQLNGAPVEVDTTVTVNMMLDGPPAGPSL